MIDPHFAHKGIRESSYYQLTIAWGSLILRGNRAAKGSPERKAIERWIGAVKDEKKRRDRPGGFVTDFYMAAE